MELEKLSKASNLDKMPKDNTPRTPTKTIPGLSFSSSSPTFFDSPKSFDDIMSYEKGFLESKSRKSQTSIGINSPYTNLISTQFSKNGLSALESSPPGQLYPEIEDMFKSPLRRPQKIIAPLFSNNGFETKEMKKSKTDVIFDKGLKTKGATVHTKSHEGQAILNSLRTNPRKRRSSINAPANRSKIQDISAKALLSSKVFEQACESQRSLLLTPPGNGTKIFSNIQRGETLFSSKIDNEGRMTLQTVNAADSPSNKDLANNTENGAHRNYERFINIATLIGEDKSPDSDIDEEDKVLEDEVPRTPPRFGNLGNCDAAAAFAKTLARTRDHGNGSMFMFPLYNTPDSARLTSYLPCTPRLPSEPSDLDESALNGMMTPPGAVFTYENNAGLTGLTPFLINGDS